MPPRPPQDQRQYVRVPFGAAVELQLPDRSLAVQLLDIALKGALLQVPPGLRLALQQPCRLVLRMADNGEGIAMDASVVHLEGLHVGIACTGIDVTSLTRLRRLLELNTGDAALLDRELRQLFGGT